MRQEDREALYAVAKDPLIWEQHPQPDRHERQRFDVFFDEAVASGGALAVEDRTGRMVGTTRYCLNEKADRLEIGWTFLERALWGGTANRELKLLMLAHAFQPRRSGGVPGGP